MKLKSVTPGGDVLHRRWERSSRAPAFSGASASAFRASGGRVGAASTCGETLRLG